jgi:YVTN family beta-propeller protein
MNRFVRPALICVAVLVGAVLVAPSADATQTATSLGKVTARIAVGSAAPGFIFDGTFGAGSLWASVGNDTIRRIDPASNTVVAEIAVGAGFRHEIAVGEGAVWVTNPDADTVSRIDPATNAVVATIPTAGHFPIGVTTTSGAVWVSNHHADPADPDSSGSVVRIDPATNAVVAITPVGAPFFSGGPGGMTAAGGSVWVGVPNLGGIVRIDPATSTFAGFTPLAACGVPIAGDGAVWIPSAGCAKPASALARINATSGSLDMVLNPGGASWFAATGFGSAWVSVTSLSCPPKCPPSARGLVRLDVVSGAVTGRLATDGFGFVAVGAGSIWAGLGEAGQVVRIDPN